MTNKQVIVIFVAGIALLFGAFLAGMNAVRESEEAPANVQASVQSSSPARTIGQDSRPAASEHVPDARYYVVVATLGTEEKANELTAQLRTKQYLSAKTQKPDQAKGERVFRVMIGPYDRRDVAERVQNELTVEGRKGVTILERTPE